jgi:hypothetical protein
MIIIIIWLQGPFNLLWAPLYIIYGTSLHGAKEVA